MSIPQVTERTSEVAAAGLEGVIVETNFCSEITAPVEWLALLPALKPVLDGRHAS